MDKDQKETPAFDFVSGGIKGVIEAILFKLIGVETNARLAYKKAKK